MADSSWRPPKCVVLFGDGVLLPSSSSSCSSSTLDAVEKDVTGLSRVAVGGCCGMLALREQRGERKQEHEGEQEAQLDSDVGDDEVARSVSELAQLLGTYGRHHVPPPSGTGGAAIGDDDHATIQTIPSGYKGMRVSFASNSTPASALASLLGCRALSLDARDTREEPDQGVGREGGLTYEGAVEIAVGTEAARTPLPHMAVSGSAVYHALENSADVVFVHVHAESVALEDPSGGIETPGKWERAVATLRWMSGFVDCLGSGGPIADGEASSGLFMVVVASWGSMPQGQGSKPTLDDSHGISNGNFNDDVIKRPVQTYLRSGARDVDDVRLHHPMLAAYRCDGITRRDMTKKFSETEIQEKGANGMMLADHFLAEMAFKLGFAPKYGA